MMTTQKLIYEIRVAVYEVVKKTKILKLSLKEKKKNCTFFKSHNFSNEENNFNLRLSTKKIKILGVPFSRFGVNKNELYSRKYVLWYSAGSRSKRVQIARVCMVNFFRNASRKKIIEIFRPTDVVGLLIFKIITY